MTIVDVNCWYKNNEIHEVRKIFLNIWSIIFEEI